MENLFKINFAQKGIKLRFKIEDSIPQYLKGDEIRIKQILINIISNSLKFTEKGSVDIIVLYKNRRLFVTILDTGIGIRKEAISNIFDSFEQLDVNRHGTGLGLSITKTLCKLMEGDINVKSTLGEGSEFSFDIKLPIGCPLEGLKIDKEDFEEYLPPSKSLDLGKTKRRFKILVAEDIKDNQLVLEMILKKLEDI